LMGLREGIGRETQIRYAWGTPRLTCELSIMLTRDAAKKWGKEIGALIASIEMTGRAKNRKR
ncbi:MAG: hypothetical protein ACC662_07575, partial [Planctomycetota bacterium]